ncbi:MAG: hypothetical protein ACD_81C00185G0007 [uncultured bacterium]|uniref:DUF1761 domain-containing protein n=2 Tax=Candidatus Wolfeibacteriota TaxID=1752735 RepID=A0A0G1K7B4_9BACT|nr:MAG: hypothetical protein ACD_81C00185G0007 [uncultured bacterium]KKR12813.1 MAG: hypothetical protein UT41_C0001G0357 [Candidatus Wolfebacteria bacterium GW2011_GWC2_39_22]KKT43744.1 MAG: hypothetical protein UW32_C0001G0336 [Candidatus Wolfebacteria bacterium GW2011_GWE2_44_13]HBI25525.1 hypothetical protein [Candidatus Wolfebacteria bacterium]
MITINYWAVLVCAILSMVLGFIWYGPLFGKKWLEITGATKLDEIVRREMMKRANKLYVVQFILSLFQVWVLAYYIAGWTDASGLINALWIWAAFIMPTVAGSAMWNNDSAKVSWARFLIQAGYQLVLFVLFGLILGMWH